MKEVFKKITSLFFLLLGLAPMLLVVFFTLRKQEIRNRMKERLHESHQLQTVVVPADEVTWVEDHEIWVDDKMFDIQTQTLQNGVYTFTGLFDIEETLLEEEKKKAGDKKKGEDKLLSKLLKSLPVFCFEPDDHTTSFLCLMLNSMYWFSPNIKSCYQEILTPPPQGLL